MHDKIQRSLSEELAPAIDWLGQNMCKSSKNIIFWNPPVAFDYGPSSQSQWSILPMNVDWCLDELEPWNKNELIARYKRKRLVPQNDYFIFSSWLPEGSRLYPIKAGHKFWPDVTCVIDQTMRATIRFARQEAYFFLGVSNCKTFWCGAPYRVFCQLVVNDLTCGHHLVVQNQ